VTANSATLAAPHTAASLRESIIEVEPPREEGKNAPNRQSRTRGARSLDPRPAFKTQEILLVHKPQLPAPA
jgi:hypothetical protein